VLLQQNYKHKSQNKMSKNEIVKYQCKCGKMKSPYAMAPLVGTCRYCLTQCDKLIKKT